MRDLRGVGGQATSQTETRSGNRIDPGLSRPAAGGRRRAQVHRGVQDGATGIRRRIRRAGRYTRRWDGRGARGEVLPEGIYLLVLDSRPERVVRKVILAR